MNYRCAYGTEEKGRRKPLIIDYRILKTGMSLGWLLVIALSAVLALTPGQARAADDAGRSIASMGDQRLNPPPPLYGARQAVQIQSSEDESSHSIFRRRVFRDLGGGVSVALSDLGRVYTSPTRLNRKSALYAAGLLSLGGVIFACDQEIYDALHRSKNDGALEAIIDVGEGVEQVGHGGITTRYYVGAFALGYVSGIKPLRDISIDVLESYYLAGSVKNMANFLWGRRRPHSGLGPYEFKLKEGTSFPSGHASNVIQLANILSRHIDFTPFTVAAYSVAGSVCLQRITSDNHWPSDVYFAVVYAWFVSDEVLRLNRNRRLKVVPAEVGDQGGLGMVIRYQF